MGFVEAAGQVHALIDQRQRGAELPLAQQDPGSLIEQVGDQVLIPSGSGNGQRLLAVVPGDRVTARLVQDVSRRGQRPGTRQRRVLGRRYVQQRTQHADAFGGVPAYRPVHVQRDRQPQARCRVRLGLTEGDGGPQVVQLGIEPVQPLPWSGPTSCGAAASARAR